MMNCYQQLIKLHSVCNFQSTEGSKVGPASNSELRRWFKAGCIEVNFNVVQADEDWPAYVKSIVLFPKNQKKRCTLFYDSTTVLIQLKE